MNIMEGTIVFEFPGKENEERINSVGIEVIEIKKRWILDTFLLATEVYIRVDLATHGARSLYAWLKSFHVHCSVYDFCGEESGRL